MTGPVVLIGAGGHARVVLDALRSMARECLGVASPGCDGLDDAPALGDDAAVFARFPNGCEAALGVGGAPGRGEPGTALRQKVYEAYRSRGFNFPPVTGRGALVPPSALLDDGAQIMAGAVLQPGVRIGFNAVVNTGACVDHDAHVQSHAMIAPGAVLCGGVRIGEGAYVGAGAVVLQGITVGARAIIAAGAVATADVADGGYVSRR